MALTDRFAGDISLLFLSFVLAFPAFGASDWKDSDLAVSGAGDKLVSAAASEASLSGALELLEKNAPRLPNGDGKKKALSVLAQLRELAGSYSLAAEAWSAAAVAEEGMKDDLLVLESARCLIAVGEIDRALADIQTVLLTGKENAAISRARLLSAYASAFRRDDAAVPFLRAFSRDANFAAERPTILYLLARLFDDRASRDLLAAEYPASPEARILAGTDIALAALPHWLLAADRQAVSVVSETPVKDDPEPSAAALSAPLALQLGLFKEEKNARSLVSRLATKGFTAFSAARKVGGASYWAVTVAPGPSAADTMMRLKDAGFESFPLF